MDIENIVNKRLVKFGNNKRRSSQVRSKLMNIEVEKNNNNYKNDEDIDVKTNNNDNSRKSTE